MAGRRSDVFDLRAVSGFKAGRTAAVETVPVRAATECRINAVIAVAGRHIGTLIAMSSVTGAHPGEMLSMCGGDIESGNIKTAGELLGHKSIQITELYAEQDTQRAMGTCP